MTRERDIRLEEEKVLLLNKGRRGLLRVIFGRTLLLAVLILLQVWLLVSAFVRMGEIYFGSAAVVSLVAALVVPEAAAALKALISNPSGMNPSSRTFRTMQMRSRRNSKPGFPLLVPLPGLWPVLQLQASSKILVKPLRR